jgi:hypothetical protein
VREKLWSTVREHVSVTVHVSPSTDHACVGPLTGGRMLSSIGMTTPLNSNSEYRHKNTKTQVETPTNTPAERYCHPFRLLIIHGIAQPSHLYTMSSATATQRKRYEFDVAADAIVAEFGIARVSTRGPLFSPRT